MSNYLAVATVTAALRSILRPAVSTDISGADVNIGRPQSFTGAPPASVNVFLYHAQPHPSLRNDDLPTRRTDGSLVTKPRIPLELDYLFTFYGNQADLEPERLFAITARTLQAISQISRAEITDIVNAAKATPAVYAFLSATDLGDQVELVKLTQLPLTLEDLSRLWALFPDIPYALSIAYRASVVVLEEDVQILPVSTVQSRDIHVNPLQKPVIVTIASAAGAGKPITAGTTLVISGAELAGPAGAVVALDGMSISPAAPTPSAVQVPLPAAASGPPAGPVQVRITQLDSFGSPPAPRPTVSSDAAVFLLQPKITAAVKTGVSGGPALYAATIQVTVDIPVQPGQTASLVVSDNGTGALQRVLTAAGRTAATNQVDFPIDALPGGTYALVLQVDGASSPPPAPTVTVP